RSRRARSPASTSARCGWTGSARPPAPPGAGSGWCSNQGEGERMYPTLRADPDRAAWIDTTVAELARFGEQHRDALDAANRAGEFPREIYRDLGKLGYLGPLVPQAYGGLGGR